MKRMPTRTIADRERLYEGGEERQHNAAADGFAVREHVG